MRRENFLVFVRTVLERVGFVLLSTDGDGALAAVRQLSPQLVLLDVCLPGASGYEVHHELKDRYAEELPIMFVSAERIDTYDRVAGLCRVQTTPW
jgi:DNA-binding response OmpR family regulator